MKNAFEYLRWANPEPVGNSYEQLFYDQHCSLFNLVTLKFNESYSSFSLIKSDIVLRGLLNRKIMNEDIGIYSQEQLENKVVKQEILSELPFLESEGERIYVPTYSREINSLYAKTPSSFKKAPYQDLLKDDKKGIIDPFITYGFALFASPFTRLTPLDEGDDESEAFYHVGYHALYFIHRNGTLKEEIPLFDDRLKDIHPSDLFERVKKLAHIYYTEDTISLIHSLKDLHLISSPLYEETLQVQAHYDDKMLAKARKAK